ncbi:MAG: hypothetical protein HYV51_02590 [Parcubacteria group bacterium]|nr:hypothetical protein [Parcubacteria group bacterium]
MNTITENNLTWIDIEKPTHKDIEWLRANFNFHPITLGELIPPSKREKVEQFNDYLFLVMYAPIYQLKKRTTEPVELDVLITKSHVITLHNEHIEPLNIFSESLKKIEMKRRIFSATSGHLLYFIIEDILSFAERQLAHISKNISMIEDNIFKNISRDMIKEVSTIKRDVLDFRMTIRPLYRIFNSLHEKSHILWSDDMDIKVYFTDLIGDYNRLWHEIDNYADTLDALEKTNINLINDKTNTIVKTFTIMSFLTFPAMLVATILQINTGTNPILGRQNDFWIILGIVVITILVMLTYFKTRKWL